MERKTETIEIEAFGEKRVVECWVRMENGELRDRIDSVGVAVVGKFPTGTKLHRSTLTLWKKDRGVHSVTGAKLADVPGRVAAIVDGVEFVLGTTLYTHNRNSGRIVGWCDEVVDSPVVAQWKGAL